MQDFEDEDRFEYENELPPETQGGRPAPVVSNESGSLQYKKAPRRKSGDVDTRDAVEFAGQVAEYAPDQIVPGGGLAKKSISIASQLFEATEEGADGQEALQDIADRFQIPLETLKANSRKLRALSDFDNNRLSDEVTEMAPGIIGEAIGGGLGILMPIPGLNFMASYFGSRLGEAAGEAVGGEIQKSVDPTRPTKGVDVRTIFFTAEEKQLKAQEWLSDENNDPLDLPSEIRVSKLEAALLAMDEEDIREVARKAKNQISKDDDPAVALSKLKGIVYSTTGNLNLKVTELESMGLVQAEPGERPEATIARAMNTLDPETGQMQLHPLVLIMDNPSNMKGLRQASAIQYDPEAQFVTTAPRTPSKKSQAGPRNSPTLAV